MTPVTPQHPHDGAQLVVFAEHQKEYAPLPAAVSPDGVVQTEWELSAEDLSVLLNGGRVRLWLWTFGRPIQPVMLEVSE